MNIRLNKVQSISRSADILVSLKNGNDRLTDIAKDLKLSKATVYRMLKTLEDSHLVVQDLASRRYYLGELIVTLASSPFTLHKNLILSAFEDMKYVRDVSNESVSLQIPVGIQRLFLEVIPTSNPLRNIRSKGSVSPLCSGACGKILLSQLADREASTIIRELNMDKLAPGTITDKRVLIEEIKEARKRGYATSVEEVMPSVTSIAVPVKNYTCPVALTMFGPSSRFDNINKYLEELLRAAERISNKLSKLAGRKMRH